ncbi:MAG: acyl carrier protein [Steroidobacteraceae bacterium]
MSVRDTIVVQFQEVAKESNLKLAPLTDDLPLTESGLDSLWFAIIVARLEDLLGFDPFADIENNRFPVTFGDFVTIYDNVAK